MMGVKDRIRQLAKERGYETDVMASSRLGYSYNTYRRYVDNSARGVPITALEVISRHYGVNVAWLLTGELPKYKMTKKDAELWDSFSKLPDHSKDIIVSAINTASKQELPYQLK
ncbi:hypothetical protein CCP2SC5_840022 [Azospirillaceae bacterium]